MWRRKMSCAGWREVAMKVVGPRVNTKRNKEARCRRSDCLKRCCIRDGGAGLLGWWSSAVALQGEAANHRKLLRSRVVVVSVAETARR